MYLQIYIIIILISVIKFYALALIGHIQSVSKLELKKKFTIVFYLTYDFINIYNMIIKELYFL